MRSRVMASICLSRSSRYKSMASSAVSKPSSGELTRAWHSATTSRHSASARASPSSWAASLASMACLRAVSTPPKSNSPLIMLTAAWARSALTSMRLSPRLLKMPLASLAAVMASAFNVPPATATSAMDTSILPSPDLSAAFLKKASSSWASCWASATLPFFTRAKIANLQASAWPLRSPEDRKLLAAFWAFRAASSYCSMQKCSSASANARHAALTSSVNPELTAFARYVARR
mmetsp:Transcript_76535/g.135000  ORF Transcript_76535/g.135000 Transcript_76535/m.135000 type:complete len:234 (+) Transcript_76535:1040-1741(+)